MPLPGVKCSFLAQTLRICVHVNGKLVYLECVQVQPFTEDTAQQKENSSWRQLGRSLRYRNRDDDYLMHETHKIFHLRSIT